MENYDFFFDICVPPPKPKVNLKPIKLIVYPDDWDWTEDEKTPEREIVSS